MLDPSIDYPSVLVSALLHRASAHVIIVEPSSSIRMMIMDVLRAAGFEKLKGASNLKEALHYLETEKVDWIITSLFLEQGMSALKILKLISERPELKTVSISVLIDRDKETPHLSQAFELGLLSWHPRPFAREEMQQLLDVLMAHISKHDGQVAFVAAEYIRPFLIARKYFRSLAAMEEELMALNPGSTLQMMALAEAELWSGRQERGCLLLAQVASMDESLAKLCEELKGQFETPDDPFNLSAFGTVVIVEPDPDVGILMQNLLKKIDVMNPEVFHDGAAALEWISVNNNIDLIIMEWKIPGMTGPVLLQRLRKFLKLKTLIVVTSAVLKPNERPLLREMGVDDLFEKPVDNNAFLSRLVGITQHKQYSSRRIAQETKIRRLLAAKRTTEAQLLLDGFLKDEKVHEGVKKELQGELEYQNNEFARALALSIEALKLEAGHKLGLLNLAGKCFLKLEQYESAIKCLERAKEISPMNFERLFALAECRLAIDQIEEAEEGLLVVKELDPLNPMLTEIQTKIDLEVGRKISPLIEELDPFALKRIAAYINNRAVSLVRTGRVNEGTILYERALNALPEKAHVDRSLVTYNLALAYARNSQFEAALETLGLIEARKGSAILKKKAALSKRIDRLLQEGVSVWPNLPVAESTEIAEVLDSDHLPPRGEKRAPLSTWDDLMNQVIIRKGDIGCFLLFRYLDTDKSQLMQKFADPIKFQKR